jgi:FAD-dependent urate hydroxylase
MRILVVGAGIAGPVTAMALQKAGFEPTVHEAFDRTAEGVGSFINIGPNGLDALGCLDLAEVVRRHGFDTPVMAFHDHNGRRITPDIRTDRLSHGGRTIHTLRRSELYVALRDEAAWRGIPIEYGKRLTGATRTRSGVRAEFEDGSSAEGAVLVGADGLHSRVRRIIDPAAPPPRYLGVCSTRSDTSAASPATRPAAPSGCTSTAGASS